jgi:predicted Zn finger-like uncharacterized protein
MIIQCEQCRTKFRLDDSRVKDAGVKVRCAKCKHVFTVRKELSDTLPQPAFAALLDQTAGFYEQVPPASQFASEPESAAAEAVPVVTAVPFAGAVPEESVAAMDSTQFEPPEQDLPPSEMPASESGFSEESKCEQALKTDKTPFPGFDSDFAGFDSATAAPDTDKTGLPPAELSDSTDKFTFQATDASNEVIDSAPKPATVQTREQIPDQPVATQAAPVATREEQKPETPTITVPPVPTPSAPASAASEELPPLSISSRRARL